MKKEDISSVTTHWNIQSWKSETSFYHFYFWKSNSAVECLHDISHPRQFLFRSLWDGHQVQAIDLGLWEQVRLSIVLVISDFLSGSQLWKVCMIKQSMTKSQVSVEWGGRSSLPYMWMCKHLCRSPTWAKVKKVCEKVKRKKRLLVTCIIGVVFWGGFEVSHQLSLIWVWLLFRYFLQPFQFQLLRILPIS